MGKVKETVIDMENDPKTEIEAALTHIAISMAYVPKEGWSLIEVKFNPITGDVGTIQKSYTGEYKDYVVERMKIKIIDDGLFTNCGNPYNPEGNR